MAFPAVLKQKAKAKYRNEKVKHDGMTFDSKRERDRWIQLTLLARAGEITELERQVPFLLHYNGTPLCAPPHERMGADRKPITVKGRQYLYRADFTYRDRHGRLVVEDAKGVRTPDYALKKALVEVSYGVVIREV